MHVVITPAPQLTGEVVVPGDKSISHRGVMLGALAEGKTRLSHFLAGEDCYNTIKAFQNMGIDIRMESCFSEDGSEERRLVIQGKGLHGLKKPVKEIQAGNSGTTTRLLAGILAGQPFEAVLDGDISLRKRPMDRIIEPLRLMGAKIGSRDNSNTLPLAIQGGRLKGIEYTLPVASAQVKSAIILASLYADSPTVIHQPAPSRDHTEILLRHFGGRLETRNHTLTAYPAQELQGRDIRIPGDISSAAFFITAALLVPHSRITMKRVGINPTRTGILDIYHQMGADISITNIDDTDGEPVGDITATHCPLYGIEIGGSIIPRLIDEIPILALAATQAHGTTVIRDAGELKVKESNRIDAVVRCLRAFGADIEPTEDGMIINGPSPLTGNIVTCRMDHRIAMMAAVAGLIAEGQTIITDGQWVNVSFPGFFQAMDELRS
jgi:3-phosphoshikimate 1-carboxyvinyltransferase